jgi:hypothetical protein
LPVHPDIGWPDGGIVRHPQTPRTKYGLAPAAASADAVKDIGAAATRAASNSGGKFRITGPRILEKLTHTARDCPDTLRSCILHALAVPRKTLRNSPTPGISGVS